MVEQTLIIEPGGADRHYWRDIWSYREIFILLAWRDIKVRYKQTVIGIAWAVLRPFLTMLLLTLVFSRLAKLPSDGQAPYALMVFAGMLPWYLFSSALSESSASIVNSSNMIGKVYFPRMIVPLAASVTALIDFLLSLVLLVFLMVWYRFLPGWQVLLLPVFIFLAMAASIGPGLWITALNVKYRDFRYLIPFMLQLGLYASPVAFSSARVPEEWRLLYSLNPVVGVIDGFRWCLLGGQSVMYWPGFALSVVSTAGFLALGVVQFRKVEKSFADLV